MENAGIRTAEGQALLIAQMGHETMGFTRFEELMSYSAKRLMQVWPSRFPDLATAQAYANNPRKLANYVYGSRMGNRGGDDGWNFRGSGALQHSRRARSARSSSSCGGGRSWSLPRSRPRNW